ncbi:MAG: gliding motility-associated protein GldE [Chitinophagales bacterium]|nr:gliding motility-associated protein GldE [Chitinophagales bacterium]
MDSGSVSTHFVFLQAVINQSLVNAPTTSVFVANLIILVLIACSAIMAASEIAFFSLSNAEVEGLRESEDEADKKVGRLLDRPRYLLSTILISNNLVNIGVVITSYYVTKRMFNFHDYLIGTFVLHDYVIEFFWNVLIVTFFLVLFGEATPKVYATHNKLKIARAMASVFNWMMRIFEPVNFILLESTRVLEKRLKKYNAEIDIEEINKAIEITVEKRESKQDAKLLKGIVHFGNIMVKQAMRPRTDVVAIDYEFNFTELMAFVKENGYSRYPVYKENPDNVVGVLNIKDLIEHLNQDESFGWQKLVREPFFVPETKKIDDLLREIQQNRKHLAVVVDEYGGTCGLITLEDIVEEVVGDITDEFDETTETGFRKIDERNFLFDGKTQLTDACRFMEMDITTFNDVRGEAETMAGLLLEIAGRIPKNGEELRVLAFKFTVISVLNNRIEKIRVTNEG